jgi:hypothetical protein
VNANPSIVVEGSNPLYVGDLDEGDRFVRPLRNFGRPLLDLWKPKLFVAHQAMFDPAFPHGRWNYFRSCNIAQLTDPVIDIVVANAACIASPRSFPDLPAWWCDLPCFRR